MNVKGLSKCGMGGRLQYYCDGAFTHHTRLVGLCRADASSGNNVGSLSPSSPEGTYHNNIAIIIVMSQNVLAITQCCMSRRPRYDTCGLPGPVCLGLCTVYLSSNEEAIRANLEPMYTMPMS